MFSASYLYPLITLVALLAGCGKQQPASATSPSAQAPAPSVIGTPQDSAVILSEIEHDPDSTFIVVSKRDMRLGVWAVVQGDTVQLARFPVCLSRDKGQKTRRGDMRTPESPEGKPFVITSIEDASKWHHDFGDGRGSILAYGHWFLRLRTGHRGIGIHGSTNNEGSVPGRASEGCIRLRDADIITLKERYARVGMPVIIKAEGQGDLPFER